MCGGQNPLLGDPMHSVASKSGGCGGITRAAGGGRGPAKM